MSVLDDIKASLVGPPDPQEVTETPIGNIPSSLDKIFAQLTFEARKKQALEEAAKTAARDSSIRGAGGAVAQPIPPGLTDPGTLNLQKPPAGWGGPTIRPIAMEKVEQSPEYTADLMRRSGGATIRPALPGQMERSAAMDPNMTLGTLEGRRAAQEDDNSRYGKLGQAAQIIDRFVGSVQAGAGRTAQALDNLDTRISRITGIKKGDIFENWAANQKFFADFYKAKSGHVPGSGQRGLGGFANLFADTAGELAWDLPQIMAMGLIAHGAAYGLADGGVPGMIAGGIQGGLTHGIIKGIGLLPSAARIPAAAGFGSLMSAVGGGSPVDIATGGLTWAILTGKGGENKSLRQFLDTYNTPGTKAFVEGYRNSRAVQMIEKSGISRQDFLSHYDQMRPLINENLARDIILGWNTRATVEDINAAGGALDILDKAVAAAKEVAKKNNQFTAREVEYLPATGAAAPAGRQGDVALSSRPLSDIYAKTKAGPERDAAITARLDAGQRLAASLQDGDVLEFSENGIFGRNERVVVRITGKEKYLNYSLAPEGNPNATGSPMSPKDMANMLVSVMDGNSNDVPPPKIIDRPAAELGIEYLPATGAAAHVGEGGWSAEALSRPLKFSVLNTRTGVERPLPGVEAVDYTPLPHEVKYQTNAVTGKREVADKGENAIVPEAGVFDRSQAAPAVLREAARIAEKEGGTIPFVFNNGVVMKTDAAGRAVSGGVAPMGKEYFDNLAKGKVPLPEDLVQPPGTKVIATSRNVGGQIVTRPSSGKDRVERLMIMVPFMKPKTTANGYTRVLAPGHPFADAYGYVALHRLVWEQDHGKLAAPWEEVHHKNEITTDNRPGNLELQPTKVAHQAVHAGRVPTLEESAFPVEMDRRINPPPMTPGERIDQANLLNGLTAVADLGYSFKDIVVPERVKPGRKTNVSTPPPGPAAPEAPAILQYPGPPNDRLVKMVQKRGGRYVEPARQSTIDNGGSTFNSIKGDMGMTDHYVAGIVMEAQVKYPGKDVPPAVLDKFWQDNSAVIASDPQHLGVGTWFNERTLKNPSGDNMTYIDIVATIHATEENGRAAVDYLGRKYNQIEVTNLKDFSGWKTGGDGKTIDPNWIPAEQRMFDPELRRIMNEKPTEPGAVGTPPVGTPPAGMPPATVPPAAGVAPSSDPAVALLEGIQGVGLTTQTPEGGKTFRQRAEGWVTALLDRFYPVHKYSKMAGKLLPGENPSLMIHAGALAGMTGKAEGRIFREGFTTDIYGMNHPTGKPALNEIFKPHRDDLPGLDKYLISRAAIEEEGLNRFRKPEDWVNTGVDLADAQAYVTVNAAKYEAAAKQYTEYFQDLLKDLEDSGLMEPGKRYEWKGQRPNYAPLRRDMDALADSLESVGNKGVKNTLERISSPIRQRLGSDKPIIPPSQSAIIMTYEITAAVERQKVAKAIVDLRGKFGMEDLITEIHPGPAGEIPSGRDIVMVREAGKPSYFRVPVDLADSMKMIHEAGLGEWVKKLSLPARWLRTGATSAPGFAIRNPIRDWQTAFINSKAGFNPITDFTKGLWSLIMKDENYWKWKESGAEWSMLVTLDKSMAETALNTMRAETTTGFEAFKAKWIKSPLAYLEMLSKAGEEPTRIGVFTRSQKPKYKMSDMEAAAESRSASTDFWTRGSDTKAVASLYSFLNARAETTYKLAQTAVEHPGQFIVRGLASAAVPTILLYALNRDDPEYWKRSKTERAMFWFLPIKIGGRQVKLPKGEIGIIFGNPVQMVLEALDSQPDGRLKVTDYLNNVFQTMSPVGNVGELAPVFARPGVEWITNTKYYSGTPIETEAEKQVAPYLRYGPHTSEVAKAVGQALGAFTEGRGVGPKKLENFLYGYTGGVGRLALGLADWLSGKAGILPANEKPREPLSGTPLRPFVQGFLSQRAVGFESEPARVFYAAAEAVGETKKTLSAITGRVLGNTDEEKQAWVRSHPDEMGQINQELKSWIMGHQNEMELIRLEGELKKDAFVDGRTELSNLRKAENKIASDATLSAVEKRKALDLIDKRVSAIVDPLWKLINAASSRKKTSPGQSER